jgi:hypothetical protein
MWMSWHRFVLGDQSVPFLRGMPLEPMPYLQHFVPNLVIVTLRVATDNMRLTTRSAARQR